MNSVREISICKMHLFQRLYNGFIRTTLTQITHTGLYLQGIRYVILPPRRTQGITRNVESESER